MIPSGYMQRRKFFVPKNESSRDYRDGHESYPSNFLFECDFEEVEDKENED